MVEDSGRNIGDFEYTRRFFCRALPTQLDDNDSPTLIIQSYYVHQDNYALRVRLKTKSVRIAMTPDLDPLAVLEKYRDEFRLGSVTVKGPSVGGTRYEASRDLDSRIAGELIKRGGHVTIKITDQSRFSNEGLAANPYSRWKSAFEDELEADGPQFLDYFGTNRME